MDFLDLQIKKGANREASTNFWNRINTGHAVQKNEIKEFIKQGADINARDGIGCTACMLAAESGDTVTLVSLVEAGVDINAKDDMGHTACMWAVRSGDTGKVILLAKLGADIYAKDRKGRTVLDFIESEADKTKIIQASEEHKKNQEKGTLLGTLGSAKKQENINKASKKLGKGRV